jgi:hypothetical protein
VSFRGTWEVAQLGEEIDGAAQWQGGLVMVKPVARGVVTAQHAVAQTGDLVWHEEDGRADLCITR